MKPLLLALLLFLGMRVRAQAFDIEQLLLDVQKLEQLKQILQDLKDGYQVLQSGYSAIRDIAHGSFNLHKAYLDGLLAASPTVRGYQRIAEIADLQAQMVGRYQSAWGRLRSGGNLLASEVTALSGFFAGLLRDCSADLEDLVMVVTDGVLRASDADRLQEIDTINYRMRSRLALMNNTLNQAGLLAMQRAAEAGDVNVLRQWFGITP